MSKHLNEFINSNKRGAYGSEGRYQGFMIPEFAVREFMKGKVLLSVELAESGMQALRNDAIHHRSKGMHIAAAQCDEDADGIEQALPTTPDQANEQ